MENENKPDESAVKLGELDNLLDREFERIQKGPKTLSGEVTDKEIDVNSETEESSTEEVKGEHEKAAEQAKDKADEAPSEEAIAEDANEKVSEEGASKEDLESEEEVDDDQPAKSKGEKRAEELAKEIQDKLARRKAVDAELAEIERKLLERKTELGKEQDTRDIRFIEDPPQVPILEVFKNGGVDQYSMADLIAEKDAATEAGNIERVKTVVAAMREKEAVERYRDQVRDYENRNRDLVKAKEEFGRLAREKYPDIYVKGSDLHNEYLAMCKDPVLGPALSVLSRLPQAQFIVAEKAHERVLARKSKSSLDALESKLKEKEAEVTSLKKGRLPPRSSSASRVEPGKGSANGRKLTPDQKFDRAFDAIAEAHGLRR